MLSKEKGSKGEGKGNASARRLCKTKCASVLDEARRRGRESKEEEREDNRCSWMTEEEGREVWKTNPHLRKKEGEEEYKG